MQKHILNRLFFGRHFETRGALLTGATKWRTPPGSLTLHHGSYEPSHTLYIKTAQHLDSRCGLLPAPSVPGDTTSRVQMWYPPALKVLGANQNMSRIQIRQRRRLNANDCMLPLGLPCWVRFWCSRLMSNRRPSCRQSHAMPHPRLPSRTVLICRSGTSQASWASVSVS